MNKKFYLFIVLVLVLFFNNNAEAITYVNGSGGACNTKSCNGISYDSTDGTYWAVGYMKLWGGLYAENE